MDEGVATPFSILFVCTGNVCRSATAEILFRQRLARAGAEQLITASSAGVGTQTGWRIDPTIAGLLQRRGNTGLGEFRSRPLTDDIIGKSDIILTGTRDHRLRIGKSWPAAYPRAFTLREVAWMLSQMPPAQHQKLPAELADRAPEILTWLQHERGLLVTPAADIDIADPIGRRPNAYRRMVDEVASAIDRLANVMLPVADRTG